MSKQTIILGGGLAGLSACYHGAGKIYEKNKTIGGHAKSSSKDSELLEGDDNVESDNDKEESKPE